LEGSLFGTSGANLEKTTAKSQVSQSSNNFNSFPIIKPITNINTTTDPGSEEQPPQPVGEDIRRDIDAI